MTEASIPLAQGFAPPTLDAWRDLAARALKDRPLDGLVSRTADGLEIAPLYTGEAGEGRLAPRAGAGGWDIRALVRHPDPAAANAQALEDLAGGATSILVRLDPEGRDGVAVAGQAELDRLLDGVVMEAAEVALDAGYLGPEAAAWLDAVAKRAPKARLSLHLDPLGAFAVSGRSPGSVEGHVARAAETAAGLAGAYPEAGLFLASGRAVHEAGGSEAQELGVMAAAAIAYAKALDAAGLKPNAALPRIVLGLAADADVFVTIAKMRAARMIWARLAAAITEESPPARIEARSSGRMITALDPWTNLLRLTGAAFAAAVGGADAVVLGGFTDALGHPAPLARRQARNIQLVLLEEAHLGRVADPAAGSWFIESLTAELAREGWGVFQAIERAGGLAEALKSGLVAANVEGPRAALLAAARAGHPGILGVTRFPDPSPSAPAVDSATPRPVVAPDTQAPGEDSRCPPLPPLRVSEPYESGAGQ